MEVVKNEINVMSQSLREKLTIKNFIIYLVEGLAVAIAAYIIPHKKSNMNEIIVVAIVASLGFFILDAFSESVATGTRFGAGIGIGYNLVNIPSSLPFL